MEKASLARGGTREVGQRVKVKSEEKRERYKYERQRRATAQ